MIAVAALASGCATSRMTSTSRTGVEQLILSTAADRAVGKLDLSGLSGRKVYVDASNFESTDKGYVVSAIRGRLGLFGALLVKEEKDAEVIAEPRSGALATDSSDSLLGVASFTVTVLGTGLETPELALFKTVKQFATAKIAVHARERPSGKFVMATEPQAGEAYYHRYTVLFVLFHRTDVPEKQGQDP